MAQQVISPSQAIALKSFFGPNLLQGEMMSRYSVMGVGGRADYLVVVKNLDELEHSIRFLWESQIPFILFGGGSNTLISDAGIREVVVINHARQVQFKDQKGELPLLWAESGASFGSLARRTGTKGWSGLEWASGIPGTVGGAVVNNAGAFGSNVAESLLMAEILHPERHTIQRSEWSAADFGYDYRSSVIKSGKKRAVVLSATFQLLRDTPAEVKGRISAIAEKRQASQPQGASLGSMFKNPAGDYSGRLIEAAGLKGSRIGDVEISPAHANFFLNRGNATANDVAALISLVREKVAKEFAVELELEIQFVGDWSKES